MTKYQAKRRRVQKEPQPPQPQQGLQPINLDNLSSEEVGLLLEQQYQQLAKIDSNIIAIRTTLNARLQNSKKNQIKEVANS